jgi:hypothetical protein
MKSSIALVITITLSLAARSQPIEVIMQDSSSFTANLQALSKNQLFTNKGTVDLVKLARVVFLNDSENNNGAYQALVAAGIKVSVSSKKYTDDFVHQIINEPEAPPIDKLDFQFSRFRNQRTFAKSLELLGTLGTAVAMGLLLEGKTQVKPEIFYVSGALSTLGFMIDIEAGRHLRNPK